MELGLLVGPDKLGVALRPPTGCLARGTEESMTKRILVTGGAGFLGAQRC
jgi:hypothetical protein